MQSFLLEAMEVMLILSSLPMLAIAISSALVSLLQAITQIQDSSITHLARLATLSGILLVAGDWAGTELISLLMRALQGVGAMRQVQ